MEITVLGNTVSVAGEFPRVGQQAPNFELVQHDRTKLSLTCFKHGKLVLNIIPSLDVSICASSVLALNKMALNFETVDFLCISADHPFATDYFKKAHFIKNIKMGSFLYSKSFTEDYGVKILDGSLKGLAARAIIVINESGKVIYSELVAEITGEPNYKSLIEALGLK